MVTTTETQHEKKPIQRRADYPHPQRAPFRKDDQRDLCRAQSEQCDLLQLEAKVWRYGCSGSPQATGTGRRERADEKDHRRSGDANRHPQGD